jgi:hypothetical protein
VNGTDSTSARVPFQLPLRLFFHRLRLGPHFGRVKTQSGGPVSDPKATFEPQRNRPLPFLQQSLREQREHVLMTHRSAFQSTVADSACDRFKYIIAHP